MDKLKEFIKSEYQKFGLSVLKRSVLYYKTRNLNLYNYIVSFNNKYNIKSGTSIAIYCIMNNISEIPLCKTCHHNICMFKNFNIGFVDECSSCRKKNGIKIAMDNYHQKTGYKNPMDKPDTLQKRKLNNTKKYGTDEVLSISEVKKKISLTLLQKYNGRGFASKEIYEKANNTIIQNKGYSLKNYPSSNEFQSNRNQTLLNKYGMLSWMVGIKKEGFISKLKQYAKNRLINFLDINGWKLESEYIDCFSPLIISCKICGSKIEIPSFNRIQYNDYHLNIRCPKCNSSIKWRKPFISSKTKSETELLNLLTSFGINTNYRLRNDRQILGGKELDIVLPDYKIAIEYCGLWCHSSNNLYNDTRFVSKNYHFDKYIKCKERGLHLITIFDYEFESDKYYCVKKIYDIITNKYKLDQEDQILLDNRFLSYDFLYDKDKYKLISNINPVCWFWNNEHDILNEYEFKESFCTDSEDVYKIAIENQFNWFYDCGYELINRI